MAIKTFRVAIQLTLAKFRQLYLRADMNFFFALVVRSSENNNLSPLDVILSRWSSKPSSSRCSWSGIRRALCAFLIRRSS